MTEERTRRRRWWGGERRRESTVVLYYFVGTKDHTLGEKLALVCIEICTTHADVRIMAGDLIHVQVWISQWLRFASQGLTRWRKVKALLFLAENPRSLWSHLEACEDRESYSLFCCRALKSGWQME